MLKMAKTSGKIILEETSIRLAFSMGGLIFCGELGTEAFPHKEDFAGGDVKSVTEEGRRCRPSGF